MKLIKWGKRKGGTPGVFIQCSPDEALALIASLSRQILSRSPNHERAEHFTDTGEYVSISVTPKGQQHAPAVRAYPTGRTTFGLPHFTVEPEEYDFEP